MERTYSSLEKFLWLCALGLLIFFGGFRLVGLAPDAALYAGLSLKILRSQEYWLLEGSGNHFQAFFEHPPYFFQWGSLVLKYLGLSDGAARAIGALPALGGFLTLAVWLWVRRSYRAAVLFALMAATWGHYTKFAATVLLEAPLSLGVALVFVASFEKFWCKVSALRQVGWTLVLVVGLVICTAAKGVMGFGAWGGLFMALIFSSLFYRKSIGKLLLSTPLMILYFWIAALPFIYWAYALYQRGALAWIVDYFTEQVFRSATTNRGEDFHPVLGDKFFYLKTLAKNGWPWLWTFVGAFISYFAARLLARKWGFFTRFERDTQGRHICWHVLAFVLAFAVPLSFLRYQLSHYLHPVYLPLLCSGALFLDQLLGLWTSAPQKRLMLFRWGSWLLAVIVVLSTLRGMTRTPNRGQDFIAVAPRILSLPADCGVQIAPQAIDSFRAEAYALWYWQGRAWRMSSSELLSRLAVLFKHVYWDPKTKDLWGSDSCPVQEN